MDISTTRGAQGETQVVVAGELDMATAGQLAAVAKSALADEQATALSIGLAGVTFIDSTGLGALVEVKNRADALEIPLTLHAPSERVLEVLRLTGMLEAFTID